MPPEQPLLTIAIPTYNRSVYLAQLLQSLAPQLKDEPRVELIISDNASSDDTPELVQRFIRSGLKVRYIRNQENLGPDRNILQCFQEATGRYAWIIGDDDVVLDGGVRAVLSCCEEEPAIIHLASRSFKGSFRPEMFALKPKVHRKTFTNNRDFARTVNVWVTFISGIIISKEQYLKITALPPRTFVGTNLVQLSWVFPMLIRGKKFIHVKMPLVASKAGNTGGYHLVQVFGCNFRDISGQILGDQPAFCKIFDNAMVMRFFPGFVLKMRTGPHTFAHEEPRELLERLYRSNARFWLFLYPALVWNVRLAKPAYLASRVVDKIDKALGHPLL